MSRPFLIIREHERTPGGSLTVRHMDIIANTLSHMGYVLLPSDTAYSLAALATDSELQERINKILSRPDWPISLAFSSALAVRDWILPNLVVDHLMEQFCPGPLTIVCETAVEVPGRFLDRTIASRNRTIGVRIPDSVVERDVAGCAGYPITTAAIRESGDGPAVSDFDRALEIVCAGMDATPSTRWCAIEGKMMYPQHSTVVRVTRSGRLDEIRPGYIPIAELERSVAGLPATAMRDAD
jgi:L-threonylcarbamoyladenylate synthase